MRSSLRVVDKFLNGITMYALVVYGLSTIAALALLFSFTSLLTLSFMPMAASLLTLLAVCAVANWLFSTIFNAPASNQSWLISALILFFLLPPGLILSPGRLAFIALAGLIAMASKYLLVVRRQHLFNPAALAVAVTGLAGLVPAVWWVGTPALLPFTVILGLLVMRKLRRPQLLLSFIGVGFATVVVLAFSRHLPLAAALWTSLASSPLVFLGGIMLTEPSTTPARTWQQLLYGALVGLLAAGQFTVATIFITPEIALLLGNLFVALVSPKSRYRMRFKARRELAPHLFEFVFTPDRPVSFRPGQYLEWTLPHSHPDSRGNRRTFSIASSPTEPDIRIGLKLPESGAASSFKTALMNLRPGATVVAGQLAGNFILPADPARKLVFIAGGIGITPFRSMLKSIVDTGARRDIILYYFVGDLQEISYNDTLDQAASQGVKIIKRTGRLDPEAVRREVPDFAARAFYLSGPDAMVRGYRRLLRRLGVPATHIVTDYFSGY